ncbi:Fic/DOC family protein [Clostridium cochlearium]|uniref:Fic/DOC family protein n=1 Tax=Clostridium cochlearium TaxID=1494 RepID=UPI00241C12EE|nr:Fic family protein [Clostridium cochlearium]MBE6065910.1 hypothetical protein [Clostridium cochlearium]
MFDTKYCYPNSDVLINKLNIKDKEKLIDIEREISFYKIIEISKSPVKGNFDIEHLKKIHYEIFKDIYNWAGKIRTVDIEKGYRFCSFSFIEEYSKNIFKDIKKNNFLIDAPRDKVIKKLAEYIGDINAVHPFREGNGRTQRQFISYLAYVAGININFNNIEKKEMLEASISAFNCDYKKFENLFTQNSQPLTLYNQENFIKSISNDIFSLFESIKKENKNINRSKEFFETEILKSFEIDVSKINLYSEKFNNNNIPYAIIKDSEFYKIVFPESYINDVKKISELVIEKVNPRQERQERF